MVRGETAFLIDMMDTIANLKETNGSPPNKILNHLVAQGKTPLRNATLQIKKALKTGLKTGLIKEKSGKFKLCLAPRAYALFKSFNQLEKGSRGLKLPVTELRRRKGKSKNKRRRGRRRRSNFYSLGIEEDSADEYDLFKIFKNVSKSGFLPFKELRRRGKRRSKSRRRGGRRRNNYFDSENIAVDNDESGSEPMDRGRRRKGRSRKRKGRRRRGRRRSYGPEDEVVSVTSTESKEASNKFTNEKLKTAKGKRRDTELGKADSEKQKIVFADIHEHAGYDHDVTFVPSTSTL